MSENELIIKTEENFEDIKHTDENGNEFWYARELMVSLGYKDWRYFDNVIEKAKIACKNSEMIDTEHFVVNNKTSPMPNGGSKILKDYMLSRYACYLIAQNANPRLKAVALAQTYFAVKTRERELTEQEYIELSEDDKRIYDRNLARKRNRSLSDIAQQSGVSNFGKFHNAGYEGLYNETAQQIKARKGLAKKDDILDFMGSEELGTNLFRITQTEVALREDNIIGENNANKTHYDIGKNIRETIKKNHRTMPENLSTPEKSLKELEKEKKRFK